MPRRRSRFSNLREQLRVLGGVPPTTSPLNDYFRYITGQTTYTVPGAISGEARKRYGISIVPFAVSATDGQGADRYLTEITAYSYRGLLQRASLDPDAFGIQTDVTGATSDDNFYPALIKASYSKSGASTNENKVSGMTGFTYRYTPKRTFSFPFGRTIVNVTDAEEGTPETTLNNADELDVANSLKRSLSAEPPTGGAGNTAGEAALGVSYEPEFFKPGDVATAIGTEQFTNITVD